MYARVLYFLNINAQKTNKAGGGCQMNREKVIDSTRVMETDSNNVRDKHEENV